MELQRLPKLKGKKRPAKRIGRGYGSGKGGHTVGRGQKGQKARGKMSPGFEGGQLPLGKRLPVRKGFAGVKKKPVAGVNLKDLAALAPGTLITPTLLREVGLAPKSVGAVKILASGAAPAGLTFKGVAFSRAAQEKIERAARAGRKKAKA